MSCELKNSRYCQTDCNEAIEKRCGSYVHAITSEEFAIERKAILEDIPPELHEALSSMAFYSGTRVLKSPEYKEILIRLRAIVYNLKEPLKAMEQRIIAEQSNK